ncbi:hypothetical protein IAR55_004700 [Kwoniella newhampshirensis]|uniref:SET domain-containing protein n=1 Tax=Kwoniella newhampshirensis TaxID=1651941 RepID=A0AAW0YU27_9TREE
MVPTFWADARLGGDDGRRALEWLAGTEGERELRRKAGEGLTMEDMDRYHETISSHQPPTTEHPEPSSFVSYVYAVSLVMTRAVVIDAYHGIAIVPFCDLLNHSSSTAHTSFCCDAFVCPICGSLTVCEHDSSDLERLAHLPQSYIDEMEEQGNVVDMRVVRAIKKGEEVFSLYDEGMGDGKLLVEWGFIERNGAGDGLIWSPRELLNGTTARLYMTLINGSYLDDTAQRRTVSTQKDPINWRLIAPPDAERNPLLNVYPSGRVSIYLLTALYLQLKDDGAKLADVEDAGREIIEAVDEIEQRHLGDGSALTSTPALLVQHVVQLLEARMSKVYRPDLSAHDLVTINTDLPTSAPLERMALGLAIDERALMEGVLSKWRSLSQ